MAKIHHFQAQMLRIIFVFICLAHSSVESINGDGFSVDLIHRDSPNSPLYNPYETPLDRFNNAFKRGLSRLHSFKMASSLASNAPQTSIYPDNGHYMMKFSIGTPPVHFYGILDTGSDLFWVQCLPCQQCYKQKNAIFNPASSSSYKKLSCQSAQCHSLDHVACSPGQTCSYNYGYGSFALTHGVLSTETITLGSKNTFKNLVFGCGHNNTGGFNENEMGLIGLGGRSTSLVAQISSQLKTNIKFSYCLLPFHANPSLTSKINFGSKSAVSGSHVVSTPLVPKDDKTYYFVTLYGISLGKNFIPYNKQKNVSKGNMFIDSGVPPMLLPRDFYNRLEQEVRKAIKLTPYQDPDLGTQLCYKRNSMADVAPILTAHFDGKADVPLVSTSIFISPKEGVFCFAMQPIKEDVGIFGNFAQSNILIGFDLDKRIVSFKPTDCSKQQ